MAKEQPDHANGNAAIANQEHIAVLELGNSAWHKWRKDNPDVIPQLRGAELDKISDYSLPSAATFFRQNEVVWWLPWSLPLLRCPCPPIVPQCRHAETP